MVVSEITLFNTLKSKLGEKEAQAVVEGIKTAVAEEFNAVKNQLVIKEDLANTKAEILRWTFSFVFGALLLNIFAIIGAVIAVANIVKH
jgi:hypothetical protein